MKKSLLKLFLFLMFSGAALSTQSQELIFAKRIGSDTPDSMSERGQCVTTDTNGNVYICGTIGQWNNNAVLGYGEVNETELLLGEAFIAKYNEEGKLVWVQELGTLNRQIYCYAVAVDTDGNVYASGTFYQQAVFGKGQINETTLSGVVNDIFIAKYNSDGQLLWAINEGGDGDDNPGARDLKVDAAGNIFITGSFYGEVTFGQGGINETLLLGESLDIFTAKYDTNGKLQWVKKEGGTGADSGRSIELDSDGNIFIMGNYFNLAVFGKDSDKETTLNNVNESAFIAKYDANGNFLWARSPYDNYLGVDISGDIAIDKDNSLIFTGSFLGGAVFIDSEGIETVLIGKGGEELVLVKYTNDGEFIWATTAESTGDDRGFCLALDEQSNIFLGGYYGADIKFGEGERNATAYTHTGSFDAFIAKFNSQGEFIWANRTVGDNHEVIEDIGIDRNGDAYVIGFIMGNATLGQGDASETNLAVEGPNDILFAKYKKSFNAAPEFELVGETTFAEDFEGKQSITPNQLNIPVDEVDQVINYSIVPETSDLIDFTFESSTGELKFSSRLNEFGTDQFTITADDGGIENYGFSKQLTITITPVNDAPQIVEYKGDVSFKVDETLAVNLSDIEIVDADNADVFTLSILEGDNYGVNDNEVESLDYFVGDLNISFKVNDGELDSEVFSFQCEVIGVQGIDNAYIRDRFNIYPNPAFDVLNIIPSQAIDYQIKLYSISGNLVYSSNKFSLNNNAVDMTLFAKGIYLLRIESEGKTGVFKIVKR